MGAAKQKKDYARRVGWNKKRERFVYLMKLVSRYSITQIEAFLYNRIKEGKIK